MLSAPGRHVDEDVGLRGLDLRQVRRELGRAERVRGRAEQRAALPLERLLEDHVALLAPRVVRVDDPPLLAQVLTDPVADDAAGDRRVQRLVEGDRAGVGLGGDLVGLAGRDVEHLRLLRLLVDGHLHVRGEAAHDERAAVLLDQLVGALGADRRLQLVVAEEDLDLPAEDAASGVQLGLRELGALLHVLGEGREGAAQRKRATDPHRVLGLGPEHRGKRESGHGDTRGGEELASIHVGLLCRHGPGRSARGERLASERA